VTRGLRVLLASPRRWWSATSIGTKGLLVAALPVVPLAFFALVLGIGMARSPTGVTGRTAGLTAAQMRSARIAQLAILGGTIGCGAGSLAIALAIGRSLRRRFAQLEQLADQVSRHEVPAGAHLGDDELGRLGERLREAGDLLRERDVELQRANAEMESFSYSVSHDLRAPLRAIDGFSRVIEEDHGPQLDANGQDALRRIRMATKRMGVLIDDLLNLSRLSRLALHREPVDLGHIATDIVGELAQRSPERTVDVAIAGDLVTDADPQMIRIALQNLLDNAWKYTSTTPQARIELRREQDERRPTVFAVTDNGVGFDMAYAQRLFGAFQRLHGNHEFEGTGIGLAIVHRIVRRHGGEIWADAAVNGGATFRFTLAPPREVS
jgi:signal transduction histidine kinase